MEKLQEALARAREKRETGGTVQRGGPQLSAKRQSRKAADAAAVDARWEAVPMASPSQSRMRQARIFAADPTNDAAHFDILRTKLLLEMRKHGWTRIAITSATAGCGKTTTACNLIAGLGRQEETRAILFDFDLRRPSVAKFLGLKPDHNLIDVLEGRASFEEHACRLHHSTMLSLSERSVRDPSQTLLQSRTSDFLDKIEADYKPDLMIFDLPPVLISDEARALLKLVDGALLVAGAESTTIEEIDECEREVAGYTSVAGIVLNKCRYMEQGYSYNY